ncbi:fluoride efflux transporter FluC [Amnibacterium endophyticum]|uniref:Fluoride-specific ion channel FluC n=1 Tax=Amnibacterium endophyticum TaxID=2109337 RepID=A0ABW4LEX7_9MICO
MTAALLVLLAVAGGVGAALRLVLDGLLTARLGDRLPWGTLLINVSGSFVLGLLTGLAGTGAHPAWLAVVGTGLLGGYTTFSTASFGTVRLLQQRRVAAALLYGLGMLVLAVAAAGAGLALGRS